MNVVRALPKEARDDDQICTDSRPLCWPRWRVGKRQPPAPHRMYGLQHLLHFQPPRPIAHRPTPIPLTGLKVVELGSDYWPTGLFGERSVGIGRDGEIYLANVRTGKMRQLTNDGHRKRRPVISGDIVAWTDQSRQIETHDNNSRTARRLRRRHIRTRPKHRRNAPDHGDSGEAVRPADLGK